MIDRLVAFDTTGRESNLAPIHFVGDDLAELGVASLLVLAHKGKRSLGGVRLERMNQRHRRQG